MILPSNGRIVVIDDNIDEIKNLMEALSKKGLSFSYFNGGMETLPEEPLIDTFLMFLDLELDGSSRGDDVTQASQVVGVLKKILGPALSERSVIIITWSNALSILKELTPRMKDAGIQPLALFEIDKASCKSEGEFRIDLIQNAISTKMSELPSIEFLYLWDKLAGQASTKVYENILPSTSKDIPDINKRLNTYYEELAAAYLGNTVTPDDSYATGNMLNTLLANEINEIGKNVFNAFKLDLQDDHKATIELSDYALINASINISSRPQPLSCGSIHANPFPDKKLCGFDIFAEKKEVKKENGESYSKMIPVICEVSTLCDQAQKRKLVNRFVPGLLIPNVLANYLKQNADYLYISCLLCHYTVFDNAPFYMVLDFRRFFSIKDKDFKSPPDLFFQINENLLMHIQNRLGRHVSNPGVVYANHIKK